jgi:hypothetical protein
MPLHVCVNIPANRRAEAPLRDALRALETACPAGECWFVTVVNDHHVADPAATVFRAYDSSDRNVPPVEGWLYRKEGGQTGPAKPIYWRSVPFPQGASNELWASEVAEAVRALLRAVG